VRPRRPTCPPLPIRSPRPDAQLLGFTVQAMVNRPRAHELIVGVATDPVFGPTILFGQGGTAVEVLKDSATALPPLNSVLARDLVSRTRVARLLAGYRGKASDRFAILPYPALLDETVHLHDREVQLRPIRPEDEPLLRAFYAQATAGDMRPRFFLARREVPHGETRALQPDRLRPRDDLRGAECGRRNRGPARRGACRVRPRQPARRVRDSGRAAHCQRRGLGSVLMAKLLRHLRARRARGVGRMPGREPRHGRARQEERLLGRAGARGRDLCVEAAPGLKDRSASN
jgi:acetyltransferase